MKEERVYIETKGELFTNIITLSKSLEKDTNSDDYIRAKKILRRGTVFVFLKHKKEGRYYFAPCGFLVFLNNNVFTELDNGNKGEEKIKNIIGYNNEEDNKYEEYLFDTYPDIFPERTSRPDKKRRFWCIDETFFGNLIELNQETLIESEDIQKQSDNRKIKISESIKSYERYCEESVSIIIRYHSDLEEEFNQYLIEEYSDRYPDISKSIQQTQDFEDFRYILGDIHYLVELKPFSDTSSYYKNLSSAVGQILRYKSTYNRYNPAKESIRLQIVMKYYKKEGNITEEVNIEKYKAFVKEIENIGIEVRYLKESEDKDGKLYLTS